MPALVLHRRGDRTVPIGRGRELASMLPHARFVPLKGDSHLPWKDDQRELFRALAGFLHDGGASEADGASPLSSRETEILRLVATGMSNREIATHARAQRAHRASSHREHPAQARAVNSRRGGDAGARAPGSSERSSMPFIDPVDDEAFAAPDREALGYVPNYNRLFARRPAVYAAWRQLNGAIRSEMDLRRYELATVAAAQQLRSSYCSIAHGKVLVEKFGLEAGRRSQRRGAGRPGARA